MEQLETMHQPLDALEQPKAYSRRAQLKASSADGSDVMQMLVNMARKPHWQKEKLGAYTQAFHVPLTQSARGAGSLIPSQHYTEFTRSSPESQYLNHHEAASWPCWL